MRWLSPPPPSFGAFPPFRLRVRLRSGPFFWGSPAPTDRLKFPLSKSAKPARGINDEPDRHHRRGRARRLRHDPLHLSRLPAIMTFRLIAALCAAAVLAAPASAANLRSKAGATATVAPRYAARFQAFIDDLERHGAVVRFMGGIRPGRCSQASKHPCGMALDVCQLRRGVVDRRCRLPGRREIGTLARRHRLFSGGDWCDSDYGHVEAGGSVACGHSWASNATERVKYAKIAKIMHGRRHRVRARYAGAGVEASGGGPSSQQFR